MSKYPTWNEFLGKYPNGTEDVFEALCRFLFRTRYGLGDSLPYFYNHAGIETAPVPVVQEKPLPIFFIRIIASSFNFWRKENY